MVRLRLVDSIEPLPRGFSLGATVCSYGFAMLAPNEWRPRPTQRLRQAKAVGKGRRRTREGELSRPLRRRDGRAVIVTIRQPSARRLEIHAATSCRLGRPDVLAIRAQVARMLRLGAQDDAVASEFALANKDLADRGPVGRLFRSPSFFEDLVKTFTLCNCGWGRTLSMNAALCHHVGSAGAFPSPAELVRAGPKRLRRLCGVGYRAERIVRLARAVDAGRLDLDAIEATRDEEACGASCAEIFGLGPFGVANALQLLGHYGRIPADSETVRHLQQARGVRSCSLVNVREKAARAYARHAPLQFLRYWTELWRSYEDRMGGRACEVEPEQYHLASAAYMRVERQPYSLANVKRRPAARR